MKLTHDERRERRYKMAQKCHDLAGNYKTLNDLYAVVAKEYGVTVNTVMMACKEFGVTVDKGTALQPKPAVHEIHPNSLKVLELLKDPSLTYLEIAEKVGCTKQNIALIHKKYFMEGYDLPSRAEIYDHRRADRERAMQLKDQECLKHYFEHGDIDEAARAAGISMTRAKSALRHHNSKIKSKNWPKGGPLLGKWAYVLADILEGNMTGSEIARKWDTPSPRIFNLIAECRAAGIPINLPDGRRQAK